MKRLLFLLTLIISLNSIAQVSWTPKFFYWMPGLDVLTDNSYGKCENVTGDKVTNFKSVYGTGPTFTYVTSRAGYGMQSPSYAYPVLKTGNVPYDASSDIVFNSGSSFTILIYVSLIANPVNGRILQDKNGTFKNYIALNTVLGVIKRFVIDINGTVQNVDFTPIVLNTPSKLVIQRQSTGRIRASSDGGVTWTNGTINTGVITFNRAFTNQTGGSPISARIIGLAASDSELSSAQCKEFFDMGRLPLTPVIPDPLPTDSIKLDSLTWQTNTDYIEDSSYDYGSTAAYTRGFKLQIVGDKAFGLFSKKLYIGGEEDMWVYDFSTGLRAKGHYFPPYGTNSDVHNNRSIFTRDGRIYTSILYPNYATGPNKIYIEKSDSNFNVKNMSLVAPLQGSATRFASFQGYQSHFIFKDGRTMFTTQDWNPGGGIISILKSNDGYVSADKEDIITSGSPSAEWLYPMGIYTVGNWKYLVLNHLTASGGKYHHLSIVKTQDGSTFYNFDGTYSKTVSTNNMLTSAELFANGFLIFDASALSGNCKCASAHVDSNGVLTGVCGNGVGGWAYFRWDSTGLIKRNIDFGSYQVVTSDGDAIHSANTGYFHYPKGNGSNELYHSLENGGLWTPCKFTTTDDWVTATFIPASTWWPNVDITKKHIRMIGSQMAPYNKNVSIIGSKEMVTGVCGFPYFKDVTK